MENFNIYIYVYIYSVGSMPPSPLPVYVQSVDHMALWLVRSNEVKASILKTRKSTY